MNKNTSIIIMIMLISMMAFTGCVGTGNPDKELTGKYVTNSHDSLEFTANYTFYSTEHTGRGNGTVGYWGNYEIEGQTLYLRYKIGYLRMFEIRNNSRTLIEMDDGKMRYELE